MQFGNIRIISLFLAVFLSFSGLKAQVHWESLILESDTWKYLPAQSEPPATWYQSGFADTYWSTAQGGIGFGDNDDRTVITNCNSLYLRKVVQINDLSVIEDLILDIDYDDAFVLYINGVECARSENVTGAFPPFNSVLTTDHEAKMYSGGKPERFVLKTSSLKTGENTFAVHILNQGLSSSDLSARVFVHAFIRHSGLLYNNPPSWFAEPFKSSKLPFVFIQTNGQTIIQNEKITADMKVLNDTSGINYLSDTDYEFDGKIGIEIRGFTSANYPKKNYTVETRTEQGTNMNVELLNMPVENDWVFHGPYSDKSLMRNVLAYHLGNLTGKWSPRTKYFEMFLNGVYNGVYVLTEKIKIDKNRCNLATLKTTDIIGDELTGGYLLQIDRPEADDVEGTDYWVSPYRAPTAKQQKVHFLFIDPKADEINNPQRNYIKNYVTAFENALYSDKYQDRVNGYYSYVDLQSFIDYYIINELSRNLDGYRISTYLHKDKDSKGGKITMGPFWDYNICFGNANFFSAGQTTGWIIDGMGDADAYAMPFWWQKFRLDPVFNSGLKSRWNYWKQNYINESYLNQFIDSCANELHDAQVRNFETWNVLNTYVWPNNYVGGTYANEINYLKNWLKSRISWMDRQIQLIQGVTSVHQNNDLQLMDMAVFPNPFVDEVNFKFNISQSSRLEIILQDVYGRTILRQEQMLNEGIHQIPVTIPSENRSSKIFIYQILTDGQLRSTGKLVSN